MELPGGGGREAAKEGETGSVCGKRYFFFEIILRPMNIIQILFTTGITLAGILYVVITVVLHAT